VACIRYGFFFALTSGPIDEEPQRHEGERKMRMLSMGMMAISFVLGIGVIAFAFILVKMILDGRQRSLKPVYLSRDHI
jgi:hypothetical protein